MIIGIPKEIKKFEYRVGATPALVRALVEAGHTVWIEKGAAAKIGFSDDAYTQAGGVVIEAAKKVWEADMIVKVKEPEAPEYPLLRPGQILFCYLHLAPNKTLTQILVDKKVIAIAYETVTDKRGRLPLLIPMSEIAGRLSIQVGATALQMIYGGSGVLLGGVPGVAPGKVLILGGGVVGQEAAKMALGLGADVTLLDRNVLHLRDIDLHFGSRLKTIFSTSQVIDELTRTADLIIGAVLIPGKKAPKLLTQQHIKNMKNGSCLVDVAIDQGGCSETSRPTHHGEPTYIEHGVVHYCVPNMPGACAKTSTEALTNTTLPYVLKIANKGYRAALLEDAGLACGLNVLNGKVTNDGVAFELGYEYYPPKQVL